MAYTPLGKLYAIPKPVLPDWTAVLIDDWKINPDDLPDLFDQLNRGQSAEVTNRDGLPVRLWVDPKTKHRGVEPLAKEKIPADKKWNYHKAATVALEGQFGSVLDAEEMDALACSVARQWQKYDGVASLFVEGDQVLFFFEEEGDNRCGVRSRRRPTEIEPLLLSLGFAPDALAEVIARLNLDQEIQFLDPRGTPSILWHDPKASKVQVKRFDAVPAQAPSSSPSIFCPNCSAVLTAWREDQRQQACPLCGQIVSLF